MSLENLVIERSKRCEVFSNSLRSFVAVLIVAKGEVAWSELRGTLKKFIGDINPNTLSFHIGKLMDAGFLEKIDIEGQPRYRITEDKASEIEGMIGKDLVEKVKEALLT